MNSGIFRELADFHRFFWRTPRSDKRVVIYVEDGAYRAYLDGIIHELINMHGETVCYVSSDANDATLTSGEKGIRTFYLRALLPAFMRVVRCRVFIMTLTDLDQFHLKRSAYPVHYVYVFHSLVSTHMAFRPGAYDHYDSILCAGPHHVREIRKREELYGLPQKNLIEAGYFRLERIYSAYREFVKKKPPSGKPVALVAPSWGKHNIIESCGTKLIRTLLDDNIAVIVRPHPETIKRSPDIVRSLEETFSSYPDFTLERTVATDDSLLISDVLITDYSGIALEYAFGTERPVLFLDVPVKVHNPNYEELELEPIELRLRPQLGVAVSPRDIALVPLRVKELIAHRESYRRALAKLREEYIFAFGNSSEVSGRYIMNAIMGDERMLL